jgi:hypothetical protein
MSTQGYERKVTGEEQLEEEKGLNRPRHNRCKNQVQGRAWPVDLPDRCRTKREGHISQYFAHYPTGAVSTGCGSW